MDGRYSHPSFVARLASAHVVAPRRVVRSDNLPPMTDSPAVAISGISKVFESSSGRVDALRDIELHVTQGEFVSLIGPSGCGKSTLLRLIGDLLEPSAGRIEVNGTTAHQARLNRDYGMVFQQATLFEWRSVIENVELPLEVMGRDKAERTETAMAMLDLVQLTEFAELYPYQLSGGMQQRVAIARALSFEPSILLMDEPFGALDEMTRERMQAEVLRIWAKTGKTVVFVTHSIPEAVFLSTRVVVMSPRPGRIAGIVDIDLGQPRTDDTREATRFYEKMTEVREALRGVQAG